MKKIRLLFVGFRHGHIFSFYRRAHADPSVEIVGCIEENDEARAAATAALGIAFSDETYETWLKKGVDAVAVGGVYGERGDVIVKALEAGKHVISDKPICTDLTQLARIRTLCEERDLILSCLLDLRYLPQCDLAREILHEGRLGAVQNVAFNGQHCLDYAHRPAWYFEKGKHGGTINDIAIHGIDLVRDLTGMELVRTDAARVWNAYAHRHPDFKDCATFMARLENGAGVLADVSYAAPSSAFSLPTYWEFRFWCERGMLTFNYVKNEVAVYEEGKDPEILTGGAPRQDCLTAFLATVQEGQTAHTAGVLDSAEAALLIQREADREWN